MIKVLIHEPMTVFTDLIIFLLAGYFAKEIHTLFTVHLMNTHWHWTFAFWMIGIGAFLGAVSHGFGPHFTKMVLITNRHKWKDINVFCLKKGLIWQNQMPLVFLDLSEEKIHQFLSDQLNYFV